MKTQEIRDKLDKTENQGDSLQIALSLITTLESELAEAKIIMGNMLNPRYSKTNPFVDAQNFLHKK